MSRFPESDRRGRSPGDGPKSPGLEILFLCHRIPYPPDKGDKIRSYHELAHLARRHRVTLGTLVDDPDDLRHVDRLREACVDVRAVRIGRPGALLRGATALAAGRPLSVGYFESPELRRWVRRRVRETRFDVVLAFSSSMGTYAEEAGDVPKVIDLVDLDSEKWAQYADRARPPLRSLYGIEARRMREWEGRLARSFEHAIVCTEAEARRFRDVHGDGRVSVVRNGVDIERFPLGPLEGRREIVVFTGAMDYRPNVDAVAHFGESILPLLRRRRPSVEFRVVGRNPAPAVRALGRRPGIRVTGEVEDVGEHLRAAAVSVAPLRIAQGIQNKILEAMASGAAVVATSKAFEGLEAEPDRELLVADDPEKFADSVDRLLGDPAARVRIARSARERVERSYSWEASLERLERILVDPRGSIAAPDPTSPSRPA